MGGQPKLNNPRRYAFVSFTRAYNKLLTWDWGAAAKVHGQMVDRVEWIENGMAMFDRWTAAEDVDYRLATQTIIKHMGDQIRTDHIGLIGRRNTKEGVESYPKYGRMPQDPHIIKVVAGKIPAQDDWVDVEAMRTNLVLLRKRLTGEQYDLVCEYAFGQYDSVLAAARALGYDESTYDRARRGFDVARWELEL